MHHGAVVPADFSETSQIDEVGESGDAPRIGEEYRGHSRGSGDDQKQAERNDQDSAGRGDGNRGQTPTDAGARRRGYLPFMPLEAAPDFSAGERRNSEHHADRADRRRKLDRRKQRGGDQFHEGDDAGPCIIAIRLGGEDFDRGQEADAVNRGGEKIA